jgi:hypothetical protein
MSHLIAQTNRVRKNSFPAKELAAVIVGGNSLYPPVDRV